MNIAYRNLNYIRSTKEPLKPHLVAETFDDVSIAVGKLQDQINGITTITETVQSVSSVAAKPVSSPALVSSPTPLPPPANTITPDVLAKFAEFFH